MSHKDVIQVFRVKLEVLRTAVTSIGDGPIRIAIHALFKTLEGWAIEGFIIRVADEIFGGDHEALPVERELKGGAEFGFGVTLAFLDRAGIEIIKGDETLWNVGFAFEFELSLLIEDQQGLKQLVPSRFERAIWQGV